MPYIIPRKKKDNEGWKENLTRRLEEHIEFSHACGKMSLTSFFEELKTYVYHSDEHDIDKLKSGSKVYIDANIWDGEDRSGCKNDRASFDPDDLQDVIDDMLDDICT